VHHDPVGLDLVQCIQEGTERRFARSFDGLGEAQIAKLNATLEQAHANRSED